MSDDPNGHHHHTHAHSEAEQRAWTNRILKIIGHLQAVKRMIENEKDCNELLIQLAAIKSAVNSTGKAILKSHLEHCIIEAVNQGDMQEVEELSKAIDSFIK